MQSIYTYFPASDHQYHDHPERPQRLDELVLNGIPNLVSIPFSSASKEEVTRVHKAEMLNQLQVYCRSGSTIIDTAPTYVTNSSYKAALLAAGASLAVTRAVTSGVARNGFAIVRPPGHHAEPDRAMGFCLLNNAAIACMDALAGGVERVMVVDFDAHHGNGTQKALWNNARFGYFSTHQEYIYPGSGLLDDAPHAKRRIANFPLPAYSGDMCFGQVFDQALAPLVRVFQPGLIVVSAGFDAHWSDPLTSMGLSTAGYYAFSKKLVDLAQEVCFGKIVFVLEGGYDSRNVANGVRAVIAAMTGMESPAVADLSQFREPDITRRIEEFRRWHVL